MQPGARIGFSVSAEDMLEFTGTPGVAVKVFPEPRDCLREPMCVRRWFLKDWVQPSVWVYVSCMMGIESIS